MKLVVLVWSMAIPGLLLSGCTKSPEGDQYEEKTPVEVATVKLGTVHRSVSYNGDLHAETEVRVFSKIHDRIEAMYVDEGATVKKGAPIARIVATSIEQGVRQAEASLTAARAQEANVRIEFERAQRLLRENAISQQQFDAIQTQFEAAAAQREQAEAMLAVARTQLADATVTAPISGIVANRNFDPGDVATTTTPLVTIVQMNRVKVIFDVTEKDFGVMRIGQDVTLTVRGSSDRESRGKVSAISPVLDPQTRMARVEALVDNRDRTLRPGMFARVQVITGMIDSVIVIPRYATLESTSMEYMDGQQRLNRNHYVYIIKEGRAYQRKVDVAYADHQRIAVAGGIRPGEQIVTLGHNALRDSAAVMIVREGEIPQ